MSDLLAQHLISSRLLPADRVEEAVRRQALSGGRLDTLLLEQGLISEAGALQALSDVSGYRLVNLADFESNREVATFIPPKIAERSCVVPLSLDGGTLHIACAHPVPAKDLKEMGALLNKKLELWVALEVRVRDWISSVYDLPLAPRFQALLAALDPNRPLPLSVLSQTARSSPLPPPPPAVEDTTLEDALNQDMVEQLARNVVGEPIPLEVKKAPRALPPPPPPPPPRPPPTTWERSETTILDPGTYATFARESAKTTPSAPAPKPTASAPLPQIAPVKAPARDPRTKTEPEFMLPGLQPPGPSPRQAAPAAPAPKPAPAPPLPPPPAAAPSRTITQKEIPIAVAAVPDELPKWTLADARAALKAGTEDRDQLVDVALRYGRQTFDFEAAFAVVRGNAVGWDVRGEGADRAAVTQLSIPLDAASVFRTVALTRGSYVGPLPPDALTKHFLGLLGRSPRTAFLFPVEVKTRLVAIFYGDCGQRPISQRRLSDFILFCQDLPGAFQDLIVKKKQRYGTPLKAFEDADDALPQKPAASTGGGWSATATTLPGLGRAASMPAPIQAGERPPADFGPIIARLTGPDAAGRARAMAELARSPEAAAKVLAQSFPGPTAWSRMQVVELPEAEELGPVPGALVRLGRPAASAIAPLLDADDADTRYYALLTAGNLPYPELVDGVLRGLFDLEPDISSAARAAAAALRKLPRFDGSMKALRQELAAVDAMRRTLAARALGVLHDRELVDGLIGLCGSSDQMCAQAAAMALRDITKATFGTQPRDWSAWWAEHRNRPRAAWLVAALKSEDFELRLSAIEELSRCLNNNLGYFADAPQLERESALRRWETALTNNERLRRLDL